MSSEVGAYEAKTHLPKLLERVARGERITITKHGVPVAVLVAPEPRLRVRPAEAIAELRTFRESHRLGEPLVDLIREGRR